MSRRALKVMAEVGLRAVSCPGVRLPAKDDLYLSVSFMGQCGQSESLPAVFPLLIHEKMTFEKIFRHAVDPRDISLMLSYETVRIELVQLMPPVGDTLACFEEDVQSFLFPEPKLVRPFSGVDREVLMSRAPHFLGIAPRLEFTTKTTITECSPDAEVKVYPNKPMKPFGKQSTRRSSKPRTRCPPIRGGERGDRADRGRESIVWPSSDQPRSLSLSPLRDRNPQHPARLSSDPTTPRSVERDTGISRALLTSWPGTRQSAWLTSSSSHLTKPPTTGRYSPTRRNSFSSGLVGEVPEDDPMCLETHELSDSHRGPRPSELQRSYRKGPAHIRRECSPHRAWEEVHDRVRGLLTTPKAVRRLLNGATVSEVDAVLARRSISPGPTC